jgi:acyl-homoserine lactone acylase PvdQ
MKEMPPDCAMLWPGLLGHDGTVEGLLALNRASNFDEFRKAASIVNGASVHLGYADVDGNIGYEYITTFPIRKNGDNPLPRPGEKGEFDWAGYRPFEEQPYELNPAKGYVASFNQMPKAGDYYGTPLPLRAALPFREMANGKTKFTVDEIRNMQTTWSQRGQTLGAPDNQGLRGKAALAKYTSVLNGWNLPCPLIAAGDASSVVFTRLIQHLRGPVGQTSCR